MTPTKRFSDLWTSASRTVARRLFLDRQTAFWLSWLDPVRSLSQIRAAVTDVIDETADTKTFVLAPNDLWRGHRAGQHTQLELELDGVRVRRCYSIASAPSAPGRGAIAITVKRVTGGLVSSHLHDHVRRGDVVGLTPASGAFVLPSPTPARLLLLSGGSGITPVMSMLRDLAARRAIHDVVFVHHARSRAGVIFARELDELDARHDGLRLVVCLDDEPDGHGAQPGFDEARLTALVPDYADRTTFVCGPGPMMGRAAAMWDAAGAGHRLARESFVLPSLVPQPPPSAAPIAVELTRSRRRVVLPGGGTLLEQLERAGERPPSGCRMGICRTCVCRKTSGVVLNALTGTVSSQPDEPIRLCVSLPHSDLRLDL